MAKKVKKVKNEINSWEVTSAEVFCATGDSARKVLDALSAEIGGRLADPGHIMLDIKWADNPDGEDFEGTLVVFP